MIGPNIFRLEIDHGVVVNNSVGEGYITANFWVNFATFNEALDYLKEAEGKLDLHAARISRNDQIMFVGGY